MKESIVVTLIIAGTVLILAPMGLSYHKSTQMAQVLPYLVTEIQMSDAADGNTNLADSSQIKTNTMACLNQRIDYLQRATASLESPMGKLYRGSSAVVGTLMILAGIVLSGFIRTCSEKARTVTVEEKQDGFKFERKES